MDTCISVYVGVHVDGMAIAVDRSRFPIFGPSSSDPAAR